MFSGTGGRSSKLSLHPRTGDIFWGNISTFTSILQHSNRKNLTATFCVSSLANDVYLPETIASSKFTRTWNRSKYVQKATFQSVCPRSCQFFMSNLLLSQRTTMNLCSMPTALETSLNRSNSLRDSNPDITEMSAQSLKPTQSFGQGESVCLAMNVEVQVCRVVPQGDEVTSLSRFQFTVE